MQRRAFPLSLLPLAAAATDSDVRSAIIAMERAALDRSDRGDPGGFLEISASDVTYFDPMLERPIHGLDALRAYYRGFTVLKQSTGVMSNIETQVAGDVAVLTFNYTVTSAGHVTRWNTTEVYRRSAGVWRIIHTHWAYHQPKLAKTE